MTKFGLHWPVGVTFTGWLNQLRQMADSDEATDPA